MLQLQAGWKAQDDFKVVGTSNTSHSTQMIKVTLPSHTVPTLLMCVHLHAISIVAARSASPRLLQVQLN